MKSRRRLLIVLAALTFGGLAFTALFLYVGKSSPWASSSMGDVVSDVAAQRLAFLEEDPEVDFGEEDEINVLLLGLDGRKGSTEPHCDAIHMLTLNIEDWSIHITSVPRGTYAYIPPGTYAETEYYVANACAFAGLDYGIEQIEKIIGVQADYYATVGFSQVLGIARIFEMPTTETLQFLRHRQSYAIGDPQRSHNQAVFLKDMMVSQLDRFRHDFGVPMLYVLYTMVHTDMDFGTARALLDGFLVAGIDERPNDITLSMEPPHETVDYHFDPENSPEDLERRLEYLQYFLSEDDLTGRTFEEIQNELIAYLESRLASDESLFDVYDQALWLQVEDEAKREDLHYRCMEKYVYQLLPTDREAAMEVLTNYLLEKETLGPAEYVTRARGLESYLLQQ